MSQKSSKKKSEHSVYAVIKLWLHPAESGFCRRKLSLLCTSECWAAERNAPLSLSHCGTGTSIRDGLLLCSTGLQKRVHTPWHVQGNLSGAGRKCSVYLILISSFFFFCQLFFVYVNVWHNLSVQYIIQKYMQQGLCSKFCYSQGYMIKKKFSLKTTLSTLGIVSHLNELLKLYWLMLLFVRLA